MNLSDAGLDLIVGCEGKLKDLGDGRYAAYRCPAGVWTIYTGCTEGVHEGMIVTEDEGREMFRRELIKHEAAVRRLVTVDLTQGQFDALVSFSYNVGSGALEKSTLLKRINANDKAAACKEFMKWNRAAGKELRGLTIRRAKEAAMFASREDVPAMPQAVEKPKEPMSTGQVVAVVGGGATAANEAVRALPSLKPPTAVLEQATAWKSFAASASEMLGWAISSPKAIGIILVTGAALWFGPKVAPGWFGRE